MHIRMVFLLGFLAAALPGLGVTAWRATEAWGTARQAERAILATRAVAALQRAQTAFSAQIGQLLAAAQAPAPDLEGTRRSGLAATALLAEGTAAASAAGFRANLPEEASRTAVALLRRVEAAAAQPPARRDPTLVRDITAARSGFGDRLGQLTREAGRGLGADAPQLAALVEIASHAVALRDSLGRRSLLISSWLGGQPVTPATHLGAMVLNGRVEQSWQELQRLVPTLDSPALHQALEVQRRDFAEAAEPRWRRLVEVAGTRIAAEGLDWPEPAASFRQWNLPALAGVVALRDAALEAALLTGEARLASGRWLLAGMLALILGLLGLAGAAVTVLLRRVVRPLGAPTGRSPASPAARWSSPCGQVDRFLAAIRAAWRFGASARYDRA
ncbi:hypothetical protein [Siccirubricoccus deserti]|uniref:Uncharacterized protein n=1 Tax=Siccirubricoccus deserti TaxID=2013562 RepID=A0A9X0R3T1_9PROT|nr:hypothetical protein [Siccirubricoccus deserti]MBC4017777.1 hypothetical protein [Siccirubricoccus deserti]